MLSLKSWDVLKTWNFCHRSMTAADASPSPGSPSNLNSGLGGQMSRSNLDPMTGSNLDPMASSMGPLGLGGVGTMGRMGRSSEQRRPGSGEVFPSDLQVQFLAFLPKIYLQLFFPYWILPFPGINI